MRLRSRGGYTALELLIIITIIAILLTAFSHSWPVLQELVRDRVRIYNLSNLRRSIELYRQENGAYPNTKLGGAYVSFTTENDAFSALWSPVQVTASNFVPGLSPNYFQELPHDPRPGVSTISGCAALGYDRSIAYFSNGDHYKLVYHCAAERLSYDVDGPFYDPARPDWAWSVSDNMEYATFVLGW